MMIHISSLHKHMLLQLHKFVRTACTFCVQLHVKKALLSFNVCSDDLLLISFTCSDLRKMTKICEDEMKCLIISKLPKNC